MLRFAATLVLRLIMGLLLLPVLLLFRVFGRNPNVVSFEVDDAGIEDAKARARESVHEFIARLVAGEELQHPAVKAALPVDEESTEHVWLSEVRFEEGMFVGVIGNDPQRALGFTAGEVMRVAPAEISDWSYVEAGRLVGGFTIRYIRSRMSPRERRRLDASVPFQIDLDEAA